MVNLRDRVVQWAPPPGHSLPELIVTLVLLATCLGAVSSSAILGSRWTSRGIARQQAAVMARAVMDSLLAAEAVEPGERRRAGLVVRWQMVAAGLPAPAAEFPAPAAGLLQVTVTGAHLDAPVLLSSIRLPEVPTWPGP